jgi:hypothetical protein
LAEASFCPVSFLQEALEGMTTGTIEVGSSMDQGWAATPSEVVALRVGSAAAAVPSEAAEHQETGNESTFKSA